MFYSKRGRQDDKSSGKRKEMTQFSLYRVLAWSIWENDPLVRGFGSGSVFVSGSTTRKGTRWPTSGATVSVAQGRKKAAGAHCALMGQPKAKEGGAARPLGWASASSGPKENRPTARLPGHQAEIAKVRVFPFYLFFYIFQSIFPTKFWISFVIQSKPHITIKLMLQHECKTCC
jgi:hypothetical protein